MSITQPRKQNGQYDRSDYRCEVCDKYTGEKYYSSPNYNETGEYGLLCKKCYNELAKKYGWKI